MGNDVSSINLEPGRIGALSEITSVGTRFKYSNNNNLNKMNDSSNAEHRRTLDREASKTKQKALEKSENGYADESLECSSSKEKTKSLYKMKIHLNCAAESWEEFKIAHRFVMHLNDIYQSVVKSSDLKPLENQDPEACPTRQGPKLYYERFIIFVKYYHSTIHEWYTGIDVDDIIALDTSFLLPDFDTQFYKISAAIDLYEPSSTYNSSSLEDLEWIRNCAKSQHWKLMTIAVENMLDYIINYHKRIMDSIYKHRSHHFLSQCIETYLKDTSCSYKTLRMVYFNYTLTHVVDTGSSLTEKYLIDSQKSLVELVTAIASYIFKSTKSLKMSLIDAAISQTSFEE